MALRVEGSKTRICDTGLTKPFGLSGSSAVRYIGAGVAVLPARTTAVGDGVLVGEGQDGWGGEIGESVHNSFDGERKSKINILL